MKFVRIEDVLLCPKCEGRIKKKDNNLECAMCMAKEASLSR